MPAARREFVIQVAELYRVETTLVDQDPVRRQVFLSFCPSQTTDLTRALSEQKKNSVQLRRRIDSRIPTPLLSAHIASESARARKPALNTTLVRPSTTSSVSLPSLSAPKPKPWGAIPVAAPTSSALSSRPGSGASSPAISRASSPYVPPGLRKTAVEPTPASQPQDLVVPASSTQSLAVPVYHPPPVTDDDEWEKSDEE